MIMAVYICPQTRFYIVNPVHGVANKDFAIVKQRF